VQTSPPRDRVALAAALLGPLAACAVLSVFRDSMDNTDAALILVLVVLAVAANGSWLSGTVAAVSAGIWFDFFLTEPYLRFTIDDAEDVETAVLLLVVGLLATAISVWGRRRAETVSRQSGYLVGLHAAAESVATGGAPYALITQTTHQLTELLSLTSCRFDYRTGLGHPRLLHDGNLRVGRDRSWSVTERGFPPGEDVELVVETGGRFWGRFLMTPAPDARPTATQIQVAVTLADQVGAALSSAAADQSPA